ncbi:MAG: PQQ-dependent sugar dehydrogenase [Ilumatobacteraceae bacterium]
MSDTTIDPSTEVVLLDKIASTGGNHNGGDLDIGSDGYLYVAIGDAGRDPRGRPGRNPAAQDPSLLNGTIVRITRTGAPAPGNPPGDTRCATLGVDAPVNARCQEIYASGLRNPYRFAFDRNDGADRYFINDVGQTTFEEVDVGTLGANYGWPEREGPCAQGDIPPCAPAPSGLTDPITSYGRDLGSYVTAGAFVPNGLWPTRYDGAYLFGDGGSGNIWLRSADGQVDYATPFATGAFGLTDMTFGFDAVGTMSLYYVQVGGGLRMIRPEGVGTDAQRSNLKSIPITPLRAYDTGGKVGGPAGDVFNGTTRLVRLAAPAGARSAFVNLTYDATAGPGFVRTWAARTARPTTSSVNADRAQTTVANAAVVALADDGSFVLESFTTGRVIVDVMGWFVDTDGTSDDGRFVALDPARLVDTRIPSGTTLTSGSVNQWTRDGDRIRFLGEGQLGVDGAGATGALVVSVAAIPRPGLGGFVSGVGVNTPPTGTSNVNVRPGEMRANMLVIPDDDSSFYALDTFNIADVVVDVLGYITSDNAASNGSGLYSSIAPTRTADTRLAQPVPTLQRDTPSAAPVPAAANGASALVQNITATNTTGPGFIAAQPTDVPPLVSNVNFEAAAQTLAALAFTRVATGNVYYTSLVRSDLVVDVVGFFAP